MYRPKLSLDEFLMKKTKKARQPRSAPWLIARGQFEAIFWDIRVVIKRQNIIMIKAPSFF